MDMGKAQLRQQLQEQGYGEAQSLEFEPNSANDMHTHDVSAYALVLSGALTLATEGDPVTHQPGEACKIAAGTLHCEKTGARGANILMGKK